MRVFALLVLGTVLFALNTLGQKKKVIEKMPIVECPVDEGTQLIAYALTLETSLPDSVLYKRAMHWYKTEIESMRVDAEKSQGISLIVANGEFTLYGPADNKGHKPKRGRMKYTMTSEINGTTCVTKITRFNLSGTNYTPIEPWLEEQKADYEKKFFLMDIEEQTGDIIRSFKTFVNVPMHN